ncbi:tetratricopeptide repeat protein [Gimesia aquarii]|uniref:Uncharacterized protein n=1 Tax=Gimesia aquarii TaxID=2527964 RepID=A0A517WRT4_9PLAN|nr:hypothetical protein [Gimesia aquarii]QDU07964.1 hypothetical protein V202x_13250 [Gimesia aquarii]
MNRKQAVFGSAFFFCLILFISVTENSVFAQDQKKEAVTLSEQEKKEKALEHAKKGQQFLKQKYWKDATSEFEKAIELQPKSSVLHYLLGVSYLENSEASKGWVELRKAVLLDQNNKRAANDFMKIWNFFDSKGLLNVGTPEVEVLKLLGKPDRQRNQNGESLLIYGFMWIKFRNARLFALVDIRGLAKDLTRAISTMEFKLGPSWKEGYRMMNATNALTEFVTAEETVQNYQQLFSTQRLFKLGELISAEEMMNRMKSNVENTHQIEDWNVIRQGDNDILFEWRVAKNERAPAQYEITRLVRGKRDMHRLAYVTRKLPLSEKTRETWIQQLEAAKLVVAHQEKHKLTAAEKKDLAEQLRKKTREIIALQLEYIKKQDVEALKPYFTKRLRNRITAKMLEQAARQTESATPAELVHAVQVDEAENQIQARIMMKNGRTLTTLIPVNGKWEADTIWFK